MAARLSPEIRSVRALLDRLVRAARGTSDTYERALDDAATGMAHLSTDRVLDAVEQAIGRSEKRRAQAPVLLSLVAHVPEVAQRIGDWLREGDPESRQLWLRTIGERGLAELAAHLNAGILDGDHPPSRLAAIQSAGRLREPCNLPALLERAERDDPEDTWPLLVTFVQYGSESARPFFERHFLAEPVEVDLESAETHWELFADERVEDNRVVAAWGLAKLGDERARTHLVHVLRDEEADWTRRIRVAQALCDVDGCEFEWSRGAVHATLVRLAG